MNITMRNRGAASAALAAVLAVSGSVWAQEEQQLFADLNTAADTKSPLNSQTGDTIAMPKVACSLLTDVAQVGDHVLAIGERGHIVRISVEDLSKTIDLPELRGEIAQDNLMSMLPTEKIRSLNLIPGSRNGSEFQEAFTEALEGETVEIAFQPKLVCQRRSDEWRLWEQIPTPTRAYFTSMYFIDDKEGWVVGHDAIIMHTTDGGLTWEVQNKHEVSGEQKPLLDVLFLNSRIGFAVGTYGLLMKTTDGGKSWTEQPLYIDPEYEEEDDFHLNSIVQLGDGSLFVSGEAGTLYRSDDRGENWVKLFTDYEGSFFQAVPIGVSGVLIAGLRGNTYFSSDAGDNWTKLDSGTVSTLLGASKLPDGEAIIVGIKGTILKTTGGGTGFTKIDAPEQGYVGVLPLADGRLVLVSDSGVQTARWK